MKKEDNTPKIYNLDSFLTMSALKNHDLMQNLRDHLKYLEDKHDLKARKAALTSALTGIGGTFMTAAIGMSHLLDKLDMGSPVSDIPTTTSFMSVAGISLATAVIAGIVTKKQNDKAEKFKYFRKLSDAGLEDSQKLQEAKEIIENEGTLEDIKTAIMPKQHRYISNLYVDEVSLGNPEGTQNDFESCL